MGWKTWSVTLFSILITVSVAILSWSRFPSGSVLVKCESTTPSEVVVEFLGSPTEILNVRLDESSKTSESLNVLTTDLFTKIESLKVNCRIERVSFVQTQSAEKELNYFNEEKQGSVRLRGLLDGPQRLGVWFIGALLFFAIVHSLLSLIVYCFRRSKNLNRFMICGVFLALAANHLFFSPALLSNANPISVFWAIAGGKIINFEGTLYHLILTALMNFSPNLNIVSFLLSLLVFAVFSCLFLYLKSGKHAISLGAFLLVLPLLSPASVAVTQFAERGVTCAWFCCLIISLFMLWKKELIFRQNPHFGQYLIYGLLILLPILKYEYLAISFGLCFFLFSRKWVRFLLAGLLIVFTITTGKTLEQKVGDDPDWREKYYRISAYHYIRPLIVNDLIPREELEIIENYFDTEGIKSKKNLWATIKHQISPEYPFDRLATILAPHILKNSNLIIRSRFYLIIGCFQRGWITTEPKKDNLMPAQFQWMWINGFIERNEEMKSRLYEWVISEKYFLKYLVILLVLPLLIRRKHSPVTAVSVAFVCKLLGIMWLIPSLHLAYVFEIFILSFPLFLCWLNDVQEPKTDHSNFLAGSSKKSGLS